MCCQQFLAVGVKGQLKTSKQEPVMSVFITVGKLLPKEFLLSNYISYLLIGTVILYTASVAASAIISYVDITKFVYGIKQYEYSPI